MGVKFEVTNYKHLVTDLPTSHSVTSKFEICGRKLELLKVLILIKRGGENWIIPLIVASIEKTSDGLVMRALGTS